MMAANRADIFFARWVLFVVIVTPLSILVFSLLQMTQYLVWMILIIPSPWLIFFRKELFRVFHYWYLMIRGTPPRDFWSFVEGVDNSA